MRAFIPCLFLLLPVICFSQQKDSARIHTPAYIIKGSLGFINPNKINFTDSGWDRMTPGFQVPDSFRVNPSGVNKLSSDPDDFFSMITFSFINNKEKQAGKKYRSTTAIHLGNGPQAEISRSWFHESRAVIDTLISNQSGSPYYVVGNRRKDIQKSFKITSMMLGAGQRFAFRPGEIFQFETGLDAFFLFSTSYEIKSSYTDSYLIEGVSPDSYNSPVPAPVLDAEQINEYTSRMKTGLILWVPLDISFALSKKIPVLKRMRLGMELNYGIAFQFTTGKTSFNSTRSGAFSFRYEFSDFRRPFRS